MNYRIPTPNIDVFKPEIYYCKRATTELILDGNLDKEFWKDAPFTIDFADIEGDIKPKPRFNTRAKMLWDDKAIYFGAELWGDEIWGHITERDAVIFHDNDFEIFIDTNSNSHTYYEFEMNVLNTVWDLLLTKPYRDGGKAINAFDIKGIKTAVKVDGEVNNPKANNIKWSVEIVMPFESLLECYEGKKSTPTEGDFWRINFSRVQWLVDIVDNKYIKRTDKETGKPLPEDNWVWSPTGIINMHYPELWGFVFFCYEKTDFEIPADELIKWELRKLYYKQNAIKDETGKFSNSIKSDNPNLNAKIQVTDNCFEISCPSSNENEELIIFNDGKIEKRKNK